jgi:hypothetical protein
MSAVALPNYISQEAIKYMNEYPKAVEAQLYYIENAGKITENDEEGFSKINDQPNIDGCCIKSNCIKIIDMWNKIPKLRENTVLKFIVCNKSEEYKNVKHIIIHNKKTNKLIDVSNGRTKMIDYELHKLHNNYSAEIDIEYHKLNYIMFEGINNLLIEKFGEREDIKCNINRLINEYNITETYLREICSHTFQCYMDDLIWFNNLDWDTIMSAEFVSTFITIR